MEEVEFVAHMCSLGQYLVKAKLKLSTRHPFRDRWLKITHDPWGKAKEKVKATRARVPLLMFFIHPSFFNQMLIVDIKLEPSTNVRGFSLFGIHLLEYWWPS